MSKLLFIEASPRGKQSASSEIARTYLETLRKQNANLEVDTIDLWTTDLPPFDGDKVAAKLNIITGQSHSDRQQTAWDQIAEMAGRFSSADRYLFAVPMWNGGVPYRLKHYIDLIHQPGLMFGLDPKAGYHGLLRDKHATVVLTAGAYSPHLPSPEFGDDYQSSYLRFWLNQAGVTEVDELRFQPSLLTPDAVGDLGRVKQEAVELANKHGVIRKS